jgi:hypothetical protein
MKQETNNEMDLLLRQLGRRQDVFAPDAEDHLDADELNAYAENVLPAKARTRYTEHLAECSRCRELVVQLSGPAGVVIADEVGKVSAPSGWRKFLAGLISPMVLRYAAPALGLIVVAAIGLVVLRSNNASREIAQLQSEQVKPADVPEPTPSQSGFMYDSSTKTANPPANKEAQIKDVQPSATPLPAAKPADVDQNAAGAGAKAPVAKAEAQPVTTGAEPPAPSPAKLDAISDEKRQRNEDEVRKQADEVKVAPGEESKKNFEMDRSKLAEQPATARARPAKSKSVGGIASTQSGVAAPQSTPRESAGRDDKDDSGETRSVAGKRFRKQGSVWIDTDYDSKGAMKLTRSSEAYRTLVADEPAIKTIADQLDGEIILVWKGRPYHIY